MESNNLLNKPLIQATMRDLIEALHKGGILKDTTQSDTNSNMKRPHLVYGLQGIADFLGASKSTVSRIKATGILDPAISQQGKTIVCDADLALSLLRINNNRQAIRNKMLRHSAINNQL